jgi:hypothetical protein
MSMLKIADITNPAERENTNPAEQETIVQLPSESQENFHQPEPLS